MRIVKLLHSSDILWLHGFSWEVFQYPSKDLPIGSKKTQDSLCWHLTTLHDINNLVWLVFPRSNYNQFFYWGWLCCRFLLTYFANLCRCGFLLVTFEKGYVALPSRWLVSSQSFTPLLCWEFHHKMVHGDHSL